MKTTLLYIALSLLLALPFAGCDGSDPVNPGGEPGTSEREEIRGILSVTARVGEIETATRIGLHADNPTASGFLARYEMGQKMTVQLDNATGEFTYARSRWIPAVAPPLFPAGKDTCALSVSVSKPGSLQDGAAEGLLSADDLIHEDSSFTLDKHLNLTLTHAKALIEFDFGETILASPPTIGNEVAYKIPNTNRYYFLQSPGVDRFVMTCVYNNYTFTFDIIAPDISKNETFTPNTFYKVTFALLPGGSRLTILTVAIEAWPESPVKGTGNADLPSFQIHGWSGDATLVFTNGETSAITLDAVGQATWTPASPPRTLKSIRKGEREILIGRVENELIRLSLTNDGDVQPRMFEGGTLVLVNTVAELYKVLALYQNTPAVPVTVIQETDIDCMGEPRTYTNAFYASFDGGDHVIKNVNADFPDKGYVGGLFGTVHATVRNLHIASGKVSGYNRVGGIAGQVNATGQLINCTNAASVVASGQYSGGVAGYVNGGKLLRVINSGEVTSEYGDQGGLCGGLANNSRILESANTGGVTCIYESSQARVGGLVGYLASTSTTAEITACYNAGPVTGTSYVGGLVGSCQAGRFVACYNVGRVVSTYDGSQYCGGIFGRVYATGTPSVIACYNAGEIVPIPGKSYVGAFFGNDLAGITVRNGFYAGYSVSGLSQSAAGVKAFSDIDWPVDDPSKSWGVGTSGTDGYYWKDLGSHASARYPALYWE
ncbi:MAG: hypothetical protein LBP56_03545 [Odoribacteraceae bacterium]|jgi:hypothetical protein|nr:hypothetical protein [Odoribacteraceae bacterium]